MYTPQKRLFYKPKVGWQMDPVYLPSPEKVWGRFMSKSRRKGIVVSALAEHVGYSLMRVLVGFFLGVIFRCATWLRNGPQLLAARLV